MLKSKKGAANVTLIALIVVAVVLAAALITTAVVLSNANDATEAKLADLSAKVDAQKYVTEAEVEALIADIDIPEGVDKDYVAKEITAAINSYKTRDISAYVIQMMIDKSIAAIQMPEATAGLTEDQVKNLIDAAIAEIEIPEATTAGLTEAQVKAIVDTAIKALPAAPATLTEAQVKAIVDTAIAGIKLPEATASLTEAEVKAMINSAISGLDTGLSASQVQALIDAAIAALKGSDTPDTPDTPDQPDVPDEPTGDLVDNSADINEILNANTLSGVLEAGDYNIVLDADINWVADTMAIIINEGTNVTIDLNGNELTTDTVLQVNGGTLEIVGGDLRTTSYIQVKDGEFKAEDATLYLNNTLGLGIQNYTADGVVEVSGCEIVALGGDTVTYAISNVAGGTMTVSDTTITSAKAVGVNNGNGGTLTLTNVDITGTKVCVLTNDAATVVNGGTLTATVSGIMTIGATTGTTTLNGVAIIVPEGSTGVVTGSAVFGTYTINGK